MITVHLRINDAAGRPTAARVCVSAADGTCFAPLGRFVEFPSGVNEDVGGGLRVGREAWFTIDGGCEIPLPANVPLRVRAAKGPEFRPLDTTVTLGAGQMALRFALERGHDRRTDGWVSGDARCHFLPPHAALLDAAAEDLDVVNLLAVVQDYPSTDGTAYRTVPHLAAFSGQAAALEADGRLVAVNTLNAHPALGTVALLHSHRPVFPLTFGGEDADDWGVCDWADQCHRKGGLVVWVEAFQRHAGLVGGEALVAAVLGKIDAIEITGGTRSAVLPWVYRLWTAGFPIPLVGGSGKDSNRVPLGAVRTHAKEVVIVGLLAADEVRHIVQEDHRALQVSCDQQLAVRREQHVAHMIVDGASATAEPQLIPARIELHQEGGVVHGVQVLHIEGDGIAELAGHIDVPLRVVHHIDGPVCMISRALLDPERVTRCVIADHNDVHGGHERFRIRDAGERQTIPRGLPLELTGHRDLAVGSYGNAIRSVGTLAATALTYPLLRACGAVHPHHEHIGGEVAAGDAASLEGRGAHELTHYRQRVVRTQRQLDAAVKPIAPALLPPDDVALLVQLGHKEVEPSRGIQGLLLEVRRAAELARDIEVTVGIGLHIVDVVVTKAAHVAHPIRLRVGYADHEPGHERASEQREIRYPHDIRVYGRDGWPDEGRVRTSPPHHPFGLWEGERYTSEDAHGG